MANEDTYLQPVTVNAAVSEWHPPAPRTASWHCHGRHNLTAGVVVKMVKDAVGRAGSRSRFKERSKSAIPANIIRLVASCQNMAQLVIAALLQPLAVGLQSGGGQQSRVQADPTWSQRQRPLHDASSQRPILRRPPIRGDDCRH